MVESRDFLIYGYTRSEFLSPDLFFDTSLNIQYSCSRFIYHIHQIIQGGKLLQFLRIYANRESFTIENFP